MHKNNLMNDLLETETKEVRMSVELHEHFIGHFTFADGNS